MRSRKRPDSFDGVLARSRHSVIKHIAETFGGPQFSSMKTATPSLPLLLALVAACQQPIQPIAGRDASPPTFSSPRAGTVAVIKLNGEWRVAAIDGRLVEDPEAFSLTGNENQLWWQPPCAGIARTYRMDGQSIRFGSTTRPRRAGEPSGDVCDIGLPPRIDEVFRALDDAENVARLPSNGVLISGPNHSLLLFSE